MRHQHPGDATFHGGKIEAAATDRGAERLERKSLK
jgi:hypothetical protein